MKSSPWYKAQYRYEALGSKLTLQVPYDVFSTLRIDEGTLLLLNHLPDDFNMPSETHSRLQILDMGCGYGALSLPIAKKFPKVQFDLVDRDLLAVEWALQNAENNDLKNVTAFGSLGFQNVITSGKKYDWILCNVPARIGQPFMHHLLETGRTLLTDSGEMRIVVIKDLEPIIESLQLKPRIEKIIQGPRHTVYKILGPKPNNPSVLSSLSNIELLSLYKRDEVRFQNVSFDRPFDLGGDDPKRLNTILPLIWDALPRQDSPKRVACFRNGYGILPLMLRQRWPDAIVTTLDRDLLATEFVRLNSEKLDVAGPKLEIRKSTSLWTELSKLPPFDLIVGELSPSAGEQVLNFEISAIPRALSTKGTAWVVGLDKLIDPFLKGRSPVASRAFKVIGREGYSVIRIQK